MFRFADPEYLYLLIILPFLVLGFILANKKKKKDVEKLGNIKLIKSLIPELSLKRTYLKFWLIFATLTLGVLAAARPEYGSQKATQTDKKGIELVIAVDVSNSMMAEDITPSRLEKAKQVLTQIIDKSQNDKIAIVAFAGEAYVQLPLTGDVQSAKLFLQNLNTNLIAVQGTQIGTAVDVAMDRFSTNKNVGKSIVIITDGEGHDKDNGPEEVAKAAKNGIQVNVVGIGSDQGAPIPVGNGEMMKDAQGNVVNSRYSADMCRKLAEAGHGLFVHADNSNSALYKLEDQLDKLQKTNINAVVYSTGSDKFRYFAFAMLILLIVEVCVFDKKNRLYRNVKFFK